MGNDSPGERATLGSVYEWPRSCRGILLIVCAGSFACGSTRQDSRQRELDVARDAGHGGDAEPIPSRETEPSEPSETELDGTAGEIACQTAEDCPEPTLYPDTPALCQAWQCGGPKLCTYPLPPSAAPAMPVTFCSCEGRVTQALVNASSLFVHAYEISNSELCSCSGEEVCELSECEDTPCDPAAAFEPLAWGEGLRGRIEQTDLPYPDGTWVRVRTSASGLSESAKVELAAARVGAGRYAVEFDSGAEVSILVDLDADGSCSAEEPTLPYSRHFDIGERTVRYVLHPEHGSASCSAP